jgi:hypothetical protein
MVAVFCWASLRSAQPTLFAVCAKSNTGRSASTPERRNRFMSAKKVKALKSTESGSAGGADDAVAQASLDDASRYSMVAEAAYYRALERGFQGGSPEDDWYAAEAEIQRVHAQH